MSKLAILMLCAACGSARAPERADGQPPSPVAIVAPRPSPRAVPVASADTPSIYDLEMRLHAANGARVGVDVGRGHPTLIAMFYASCGVACPVMIEELRRTLRDADRDDVRVLLVSFDPARDTPARLRELATERKLDGRWTLAAADDADARELAAVLGVKYRKLDNGEFFHSPTIIMLDPEGRPVVRTDQFGQSATMVAALR